MKLSENSRLVWVKSLPILVNLNTGYLIGLTSGGAELCESMLVRDVSEDEIRSIDPRLLEHINNGHFCDNSDNNCAKRSAYLHVTSRCNLSCVGCYSLSPNRNKLPDPTFEQIRKAIDILAESRTNNLIISGGEPFLRTDLAEIVRYAKLDSGIPFIDILTNGTLISGRIVHELADCVDRISFSLDGFSSHSEAQIRKKNLFNEVIAAIQVAQNAGIDTRILPTIHHNNISDIDHYKALASDLGIGCNFSVLSIRPQQPSANVFLMSEEDCIELATKIIEMNCSVLNSSFGVNEGLNLSACSSCGAGSRCISVSSSGGIYPCHLLHEERLSKGNAFEDGQRVSDLYGEIDDFQVDVIDQCSSCEYKYFCGGGCRARALYSSGQINGRDPYCLLQKIYYSSLFDVLARQAQGREVN